MAGLLVFSGIKSDELTFIMEVYGKKGFACRWQATEKGWVGLVLQHIFSAEQAEGGL
jgi:hypothetical protein